MDIIKEKVSNWLGYFKDHINYFQIVDQQKSVIYFTKFTLEPKEFYEIHNFVLTLKLNIFTALIEVFKYCVNSFIIFEDKNLSEREKVMVIYSACFLNYYKKFLYDINHTFEEFYDDDFMSMIKNTFKFEITNLQLFKVFCMTFFEKMKEEIKNLNYEKNIKPLKHTYNPKIDNSNINVINILFGTNNNDNYHHNNSMNDNNINTINQINNEEGGIKEQAITYLVSAKERMVDLVFEMKYRGIFPNMCLNEINKMNITLNQLGNISAQELHNLNTPLNFKKDDGFHSSFLQNDNNISMYDDKTSTNFNETTNKSNINFNETMNTSNFNESMNTIMTSSSNYNPNNISFINNNVNNINNINNINMNNVYSNNINRFNIYNKNNFNDNNVNKINIINNTNKINFFNINNNLNKNNINNINLSNNSAFKPNKNINTQNATENTNMYSQRLMSELIKDKVDDKSLEIIKNVAKTIDEKFLDHLLNYSKKPIIIMKYFSCYIAEFTPEMLQNIEPQNKEILKNFCIRFIIVAKELYNTTMELFCSIYDLSYNKVERFVDLARNCGIQFKYAQGLYKLFKDYSIILLEKGSFNDLKKTVDKFVEKEKVNWDKVVNQFSDKFSSYFQG